MRDTNANLKLLRPTPHADPADNSETRAPPTAAAVSELLGVYRRSGYLAADLNPLSRPVAEALSPRALEFQHRAAPDHLMAPVDIESLELQLQRSYCGALALNASYLRNQEQLAWLYERMERKPSQVAYSRARRLEIYESLFAAERFEHEIARRYPSHKRFSLEGCESYVVFLQAALVSAAEAAVGDVVMGVPHRGRVNALYNVLKLSFATICSLHSEQPDPRLAAWDIKEHVGLSRRLQTAAGEIDVFLAHNPSHLEAVTPVIGGMARALQERGAKRTRDAVLPIIVHGDASFSGQGIVTETFNLALTRGFGVGGTLHIVLNNQIGSTVSNLLDARSTLSCADIARAYDVPILHVNADAPEDVVFAARLAVEFRQKFSSDILVDLLGYRRGGHNGHDDPTVTQPAMQRSIRATKTAANLYREALAQSTEIDEFSLTAVEHRVLTALSSPGGTASSEPLNATAPTAHRDASVSPVYSHSTTAVPYARLRELTSAMASIPAGFEPHADIIALTQGWRASASTVDSGVDWCLAENLAYATLLSAHFNVRLTGLDIGRGSFFHRQCIWHDQQARVDGESLYVPLRHLGHLGPLGHLGIPQGAFSVFDTPLSEEAVLGFEYGYSVMATRTLVVWEAQFGDFVNNAQVIIDQFISSGEVKWGYQSGLVMMLPHGYEGGGSEHSSAYLGRFLSLCAQQNIIVAVPSTSAQLFHLLRRQMISLVNKPLVVFTPKGQLYGKAASHSPWSDFAGESFHQVVLSAPSPTTTSSAPQGGMSKVAEPHLLMSCPTGMDESLTKILVCSGKIAYDLIAAIEDRRAAGCGVARIEQLYPFPTDMLRTILSSHANLQEVLWVQEEARNHGAWPIVREWLEGALPAGVRLRCVSRPDSAPSAGCRRSVHQAELEEIFNSAFARAGA